MLFPSLFHICLHIFHLLSLHKGILKLSVCSHIRILLSSESFSYLNLLYIDHSNKTPKAAMVFRIMVHHCFTKDTIFSIYSYADWFAFFTKFNLRCHQWQDTFLKEYKSLCVLSYCKRHLKKFHLMYTTLNLLKIKIIGCCAIHLLSFILGDLILFSLFWSSLKVAL